MNEDRYELIKPALMELDKLIERHRKFANINRWMMVYCFGNAAIYALDYWSTEDLFCGLAVFAISLCGALNYSGFRRERSRHRAGADGPHAAASAPGS